MNLLNQFALAASYVTSIPGLRKAESEEDLNGLAKFLPTIGTVIGGMLIAVLYLVGHFCSNELLIAFLVIGAWILITGAIHLDGLMDASDGLLSHRSRDKMLEIMKDSRVGNFGAISGLMLVLAKIFAFSALTGVHQMPVLLLVPAWARWAEVFAIAWYPYARSEGMGKIWHDSTKIEDLLWSAVIPLIISIILSIQFHSLLCLYIAAAAIIPGLAFSFWVHRTLHGHTGDTYGATVEFSEACALVILAVVQDFI